MQSKDVAVIGAGLTGLVFARELDNLVNIKVFDESSEVGGRLATKYLDNTKFDHGCPFFVAKKREFKNFVYNLEQSGIISLWHTDFVEIVVNKITKKRQWKYDCPHYVGVPNMDAIGKYLSRNLNVQLNTKITRLSCNGGKTKLFSYNKLVGIFDYVILALPCERSQKLLPQRSIYHQILKKRVMLPCFSLSIGLNTQLSIAFGAALIKQRKLSWISLNNTKPLRSSTTKIVALSTNKWAQQNFEQDLHHCQTELLDDISDLLNIDRKTITHIDIHRWHYANIKKQQGEHSFFDQKFNIGICGDFCYQAIVEGAFTSAMHMVKSFTKLL